VKHNFTDSAEPVKACDIFLNKEMNTCQLEGLFSRKQFQPAERSKAYEAHS